MIGSYILMDKLLLKSALAGRSCVKGVDPDIAQRHSLPSKKVQEAENVSNEEMRCINML